MRKYNVGYISMTADLCHIGHINAILKAKSRCDTLIVGLLSDEAVKEYKGIAPIISYGERGLMLELFNISFKLVKQNSINPYNNLVKYKVNAIFSGDDFEEEEKMAAKKANCKLVGFNYYSYQSTTKIKNKIIKQYNVK